MLQKIVKCNNLICRFSKLLYYQLFSRLLGSFLRYWVFGRPIPIYTISLSWSQECKECLLYCGRLHDRVLVCSTWHWSLVLYIVEPHMSHDFLCGATDTTQLVQAHLTLCLYAPRLINCKSANMAILQRIYFWRLFN